MRKPKIYKVFTRPAVGSINYDLQWDRQQQKRQYHIEKNGGGVARSSLEQAYYAHGSESPAYLKIDQT